MTCDGPLLCELCAECGCAEDICICCARGIASDARAATQLGPLGPQSPWPDECCICDAPSEGMHRHRRNAELLPYCHDCRPAAGHGEWFPRSGSSPRPPAPKE